MNINYQIEIKSFDQLSKSQLYKIMALRMAVFCVEQECCYQDLDDEDQEAIHVLLSDDDRLIAYCRIIDIPNQCFSIGRVVVAKSHRGQKLANIIMKQSIDYCEKIEKHNTIQISAQSYLQKFYYNLGFKSMNEYYLEDDIPHEKMIYQLS